jgi:hypothetical protein
MKNYGRKHKASTAFTYQKLIKIFDNFAFDEILQYGNMIRKRV